HPTSTLFPYTTLFRSESIGQIVRLGSTSMWGQLRFINGYSPIRPAGVARKFGTTVHGEIDPDVGKYLLHDQAGEGGDLARLGVEDRKSTRLNSSHDQI